MIKQPEAAVHGVAWKYFCKEMANRQYGAEEQRDAWLWFLMGWTSNARAENLIKAHRRTRL